MARLFGPDTAEKNSPQLQGILLRVMCRQGRPATALLNRHISFEEAASVPLTGMTSFQCLKKCKPGDRSLITGGTGGVGTLAAQLAKHVFRLSCVVATASPGEKTELCKSLGSGEVVNYHRDNFYENYANDPFDVCFDTTDESPKMIGVVKDGGMIMTIAGKPTFESVQVAAGGNPGVSSAW